MSKMAKTIAALGVVAGLGVAALPMSSYAAESKSANVDVYVTVDNALSITAESSNVDLGTVSLNTLKTSDPVKVSVATSAPSYKLSMMGANGVTNMIEVDENGLPVADSTNTIVAGTLTGNTSSWGYQIEGDQGFTAIPGTATEIANGSAAEGSSDGASGTHNVIFGVKIGSSQAEGTYKGSVVFTATIGD